MKYLIIIFMFPVLLSAQANAYKAVTNFQNFKPAPFKYTVCPWQSFRLQPNLSYQIDLVGDSIALRVLQQDDHLFVEALEYAYRCYPLNFYNVELIRRWSSSPGKYKIHVPGLVPPYNKYYEIILPGGSIDITKQGYAGWFYQAHNSGIAVAVKELGKNEFQVSAAIFLRQIVYGAEYDEEPMPEIESLTKKERRKQLRQQRKALKMLYP